MIDRYQFQERVCICMESGIDRRKASVDEIGSIYEYRKKPFLLKTDRMWDSRARDLKMRRATVSNWTKTLTEVK